MSKIHTTREQRIRDHIDRVFGHSVAAQEMKTIALKSALGELTDEDGKRFWEEKEKDLAQIKELMPVANDLALPVESTVIIGKPLLSNSILGEPQQLTINGQFAVSEQREAGGCQSSSIKYEIIGGDSSERVDEITYSIQH